MLGFLPAASVSEVRLGEMMTVEGEDVSVAKG